MIRSFCLTLIFLLAGCGQALSFHQAGGWTYVNAPGLQPTLLRDFDQPPGRFAGTCDKHPEFLVIDGDWHPGVGATTLSTGSTRTTFKNYGGAPNALAMLPDGDTGSAEEARNQARLESVLAGATGDITISTDNGWTRSVPASPEIGQFIAACHSWRTTHPATD